MKRHVFLLWLTATAAFLSTADSSAQVDLELPPGFKAEKIYVVPEQQGVLGLDDN